MLIVYGTKSFKKVVLKAGTATCGHCGNNVNYNLTKVNRWFTVFWIPIFPFSFKHYLLCPICEYGYQLDKKDAAEMIESSRGIIDATAQETVIDSTVDETAIGVDE